MTHRASSPASNYPSEWLSSMMGACQSPALLLRRVAAATLKPEALFAPGCSLRAESCPMEPFRILEHTADIGFEAFGSTREEVFANAARALINLSVEGHSITPREEVTLQVEGSDPPSLLVNWLSEILYLQDAEGWLFRDFDVRNLQDRSLSAVARGEKFDPTRHQVKLLVKAVTYHQLALEETAQGWRAQVYVDI